MPIKPLEDLLYYLFPQREDGSLVTSGSATVLLAYGVLALLACVGLVALLIQQVTKKRSRNADPPASDGPTLTKVRTTKDPQGSELASPSGGSPLSASGLPTPAGPSGPAPYVPIFTRVDNQWGAKVQGLDPTELEEGDYDRIVHCIEKQLAAAGHAGLHVALSVRRGCLLLQLPVFGMGRGGDTGQAMGEAASRSSSIDMGERGEDGEGVTFELTEQELLAMLPARLTAKVTSVNVWKTSSHTSAPTLHPTALPILAVQPGSSLPVHVPLHVPLRTPAAGCPTLVYMDQGLDPLPCDNDEGGNLTVAPPQGGVWPARVSLLTLQTEGCAERLVLPVMPADVVGELTARVSRDDLEGIVSDLTAILTLQSESDESARTAALQGLLCWAEGNTLRKFTALLHAISIFPSSTHTAPIPADPATAPLLRRFDLHFTDPALERRFQRASHVGVLCLSMPYALANELVLLRVLPGARESLYRSTGLYTMVLPLTATALSLLAMVTDSPYVVSTAFAFTWCLFVPSRLVVRQGSVCALLKATNRLTPHDLRIKGVSQALIAFVSSYFIPLPFLWKVTAILFCSTSILLSYALHPSCDSIGYTIPLLYMCAAYTVIPLCYRKERDERLKYAQTLRNVKASSSSLEKKRV